MKKLMVLIAVSALAIATQASQFDWGALRNGLTDYKGLTVYCVNGSDYSSAVAALTAGGESVASAFNAFVQSSGTVAANGSIVATTTVDAENTAAFFVFANNLIANGSTYNTTGAMDVSAYLFTPPQSGNALSIANASFTSKGNPIGGGGPEPIPEPTSAMLILLGMAGLALRRRA